MRLTGRFGLGGKIEYFPKTSLKISILAVSQKRGMGKITFLHLCFLYN